MFLNMLLELRKHFWLVSGANSSSLCIGDLPADIDSFAQYSAAVYQQYPDSPLFDKARSGNKSNILAREDAEQWMQVVYPAQVERNIEERKKIQVHLEKIQDKAIAMSLSVLSKKQDDLSKTLTEKLDSVLAGGGMGVGAPAFCPECECVTCWELQGERIPKKKANKRNRVGARAVRKLPSTKAKAKATSTPIEQQDESEPEPSSKSPRLESRHGTPEATVAARLPETPKASSSSNIDYAGSPLRSDGQGGLALKATPPRVTMGGAIIQPAEPSIFDYKLPIVTAFYPEGHTGPFTLPDFGSSCTWHAIFSKIDKTSSSLLWAAYKPRELKDFNDAREVWAAYRDGERRPGLTEEALGCQYPSIQKLEDFFKTKWRGGNKPGVRKFMQRFLAIPMWIEKTMEDLNQTEEEAFAGLDAFIKSKLKTPSPTVPAIISEIQNVQAHRNKKAAEKKTAKNKKA